MLPVSVFQDATFPLCSVDLKQKDLKATDPMVVLGLFWEVNHMVRSGWGWGLGLEVGSIPAPHQPTDPDRVFPTKRCYII